MALNKANSMPKREKVYVIIKDGVVYPHGYTSISGVSEALGIPERTLWRWFTNNGFYSKKEVSVTSIDIVRIKGRGGFR